MQQSLLTFGLVFSTSIFATSALADDIALGTPGYGGNGCPQGTASATLSEDKKTLTIIFDEFAAEAGTGGRAIDRKSCNIAVPIHIPQGLSVAIFKVDYRGFNSLPVGGSSRLSVNYFFAGYTGPNFRKNFNGPLNADYLESNTLPSLLFSPCGKDVIGRVNASVQAQSNNNHDQTIMTVDSADLRAGLVFHLEYQQC